MEALNSVLDRKRSLIGIQVFTRFVEVGRVAYVSYGPEFGKLCTIVDIIDGNRVRSLFPWLNMQVLVEGPSTGVKRQQMAVLFNGFLFDPQLARLYLTDYVVSIERGAKTEAVAEAFAAGKCFSQYFDDVAEIENKWNESAWAKKLAARAKKATMTDFCRFKARYAKKH